jgi:hypothetical protein
VRRGLVLIVVAFTDADKASVAHNYRDKQVFALFCRNRAPRA